MKTLLLTGSSGFIGKAFYNQYRDAFNIKSFSFRNEIKTLKVDEVDTVVHLAALVHQMHGADEKDYFEVNVNKTVAFAEKAKISGVKHFIFMSTIKVYGEENKTSYTEETVCSPEDAYGKSKYEAEKKIIALSDDTFKVSVIRTPVVYGEGVKANILKIITLTDRVPFLPFANIGNQRSMIYVGNLTYLISELIQQEKEGIFLASDGSAVSLTSLIQEIARALGKKRLIFSCTICKLILKCCFPQLYKRLYLSLYLQNIKTVNTLSLSNPYTFREGIEKTVQWYLNDIQ